MSIANLDQMLKKAVQFIKLELNINKDIFLSHVFSGVKDGKIINSNVVGLLFVEYLDKYDIAVIDAFKEQKIFNSKIMNAEQVKTYTEIPEEVVITEDFVVGDLVKIIGGDFKGMEGKIEEINQNNLKVSIIIMRRDQILSLTKDQVEKIEKV